MKDNKFIKADYNVNIYTAIGWRGRKATAILEKVSEKRAKIVACRIPKADSKRQDYFNKYWENEEIGKVKNIKSLENIEEIENVENVENFEELLYNF
jgi:hypothetical protein